MPGEDRRTENGELGSRKAREEWGGLGARTECLILLCTSRKVEDKAVVFVQWLCLGFVLFPH